MDMFIILRAALILFAISTVLVGCGKNPIEGYVDSQWPPVKLEEQQTVAITSLKRNLNALRYPTIGFGVKTEILSPLIQDSLKKYGVTGVSLTSDRQLVQADLKFDVNAGDFSDDDTLKKLEPRIEGQISIYMGVETEFDDEANQIKLKLLPHINSFDIEKIKIKGDYDLTSAGKIIVNFLNSYADNISGVVSRLDLMEVKIPSGYTDELMLSQILDNPKFGENTKLVISDKPINTSLQLSNITVLADKGNISVLIELWNQSLYALEKSETESISDQFNYDDLVTRFISIENNSFKDKNADEKTWLGIRKDLIASLLSSTLTQSQLCTSVSAQDRLKDSQKIDLPDGAGIDCTSTRKCSKERNCSFEPKVDRRNCETCAHVPCPTWSKPLRTCKKCARNPVCEIAKGAQNDAYRLEAAAKKLDCERIREMNYAACEVEKSAEKLLCETKKEAIDAIGRTGNFANIDTDTEISGSAKLCLANATINAAMSEIDAGIKVSGKVDVQVGFKFTPLDIVGHLTCPFPWTENYKVTATVLEQTIELNTKLDVHVAEGKGTYSYVVEPISVDVGLSPTPGELLLDALESTNMNLACPVTNVAKAITIPLRPFVPLLPKVQKFKSEQFEGGGEFDMPTGKIGDVEFTIDVNSSDAIFAYY